MNFVAELGTEVFPRMWRRGTKIAQMYDRYRSISTYVEKRKAVRDYQNTLEKYLHVCGEERKISVNVTLLMEVSPRMWRRAI